MQIVKYPDAGLRKKCGPVGKITDKEKEFFAAMLGIMRLNNGVGLAAPQLGVLSRIIVADTGDGPVALANPRILERKGKGVLNEGCLSVPGVFVDVVRPDFIAVSGINDKNSYVEIKAEGLMARVIQHEIDHLDGKLIIDYMPLLSRLKFGSGLFVKENKKPGNGSSRI